MKNLRFTLTTLLVSCFVFIHAQDRDLSYVTSGGKIPPLQAIMDVRHYTLSLDVDIDNQSIDGFAKIDVNLSQPTDSLLFDLVHLYTVKKVLVNDVEKDFFQKKDYIYITDADTFQSGKQSITIYYGGKPPVAIRPPWRGGFTWTKDKSGNPWVVINCQLEGGKLYFPCKDHPSDEPNEGVDLFVTVSDGLKVASFGVLQSETKKEDHKTEFHWKTNYPISNYCVVFNIANYHVEKRSYTTIENHKVPMVFYVLEEDKTHAKEVLDIRERDTQILEKYLGEYPWINDKIGIAQVPNPGMEHQTMVTFGDPFVFDTIYGQPYSENLFHEFGHEWFANKVTNSDWAHMWIQEGIDTYCESLFFREYGGEKAYDSIIKKFKSHIRNNKPVVKGDHITTKETYNSDIYFKGAFFMHSLKSVIGDKLFFKTLKELATNPQYTYYNTIDTDDVEQLFSKRSHINLKPFFDFYLRTTDKIEISVKETKSGIYSIESSNVPIPIPIDILTNSGIQNMVLEKNKTLKVNSNTMPVVDVSGNYLVEVLTP